MISNATMSEPVTYSHSLKLEETAKGIRISVHVYANDHEKAIEESFNMYLKAKITAQDNKVQLAPMDSK